MRGKRRFREGDRGPQARAVAETAVVARGWRYGRLRGVQRGGPPIGSTSRISTGPIARCGQSRAISTISSRPASCLGFAGTTSARRWIGPLVVGPGLGERGRHEVREERVRVEGRRPELRMELRADEERVVLELDHLDEPAVR